MADQNRIDEPDVTLTKTYSLAALVHDRFSTAKTQRILQEQEWITAMQNFNGEYASGTMFRDGGSSVFVNITQMKTMAAFTRIMAIEMGPQGFPWDIKPTPHPALVQLGMDHEAAMAAPELSPQLKSEITQAKSARDGMKNRIGDDLEECYWEEKFSRGVLDFVSLGTMCFKGPIGALPKPRKWVLAEDESVSLADRIKGMLGIKKVDTQKYVLQHDPADKYRANIDWVSPFELYPDPGAYTTEDAMWVVQRHVMNKAQIVELANAPGFDAEEVITALDQAPDGNWIAESWEGFINIINKRSQSVYLSKRYTVLEFWGYLSGKELIDAGATGVTSDHEMHLANVWVIGNNCIKVAVSGNQSNRLPFYIIPYEKVPYRMWGRGVPEKMKDPQGIINASARAMVENMSMAAGPQVIYDVNRVMPGTKVDQILPWGIWAVKNMEGITEPPVRFVKIDPVLTELKTIMDIFRNFVQEVTSMPDMASGFAGNEQHNRTMGGMSMLFGAADSYTRGVIFNIDNYLTKPMIRALYDWEMQYCPDTAIKGDMSIEASGVQGLMAKELTSQRLAEVIQATSQIPGGSDYLNMPELLKEIFRSLEVINDNVILSEPEVQKKKAEQQQQQMQQQAATAQVTNLPKPKAETTRNDAILQILEKTLPTDPIYPIMYAKLLDGYNEMDPMSESALNMMKTRSMLENKAFADAHEMQILQQDIEMENMIKNSSMGAPPPGGGGEPGQPEQEPAPAPPTPAPAPAPPAPVHNVHVNIPGKPSKHRFIPQPDGSMVAEPIEEK